MRFKKYSIIVFLSLMFVIILLGVYQFNDRDVSPTNQWVVSNNELVINETSDLIDENSKVLDLGTGNAPIPLYLTLKTNALITGVEIQKDVYDLAVKSVKVNNFDKQINIINDDLKGIYKKVGANCFDIVSTNPPYFKYKESSLVNKNDYLTIARHEVMATLDDIVTEASKLLVYKAAMKKNEYAQGKKVSYSMEAAMAKLYAAEVAMEVTTKAVQLHGGYGYTREYDVERMMRDAKITEIYEGTSEVQRMVIAAKLFK